MDGEDQDKTDPASAYKLQKSRERGDVAKSPDVTFAVLLFGVTCCVLGMGEDLSRELIRVLKGVLLQVSSARGDPAILLLLTQHASIEIMRILAAPLALAAMLAIIAGLAQVGFTLSAEPLTPDFNRINPAQGFKRLFSVRTLYDTIRSLLKLLLIALALWFCWNGAAKQWLTLPFRDASGLLRYLIDTTGCLLAILAGIFGLLAIVDFSYTRWEFLKKMRMSKREVKDEHKQREGDPRIRAKLRELRLEWLRKSLSMQKVKDADVLLTNPTHFAVALVYQRDTMAAPRILSKGTGSMALKMKDVARRHGVMVVENPPLARALYKASLNGQDLPEQHYAEVAKILAWVYTTRRQQGR